MKKRLMAGVAITDISPGKGVELAGYPHCPRHNTGVHDPLFASCIYLDDGAVRLAMVAMDILFYSKKYVKEVRGRICEATGIPAANIMISCSHTHSGPWAAGRLDLEALENGSTSDPDYIKSLNDKIVALVREAAGNAFEARVGTGTGMCGAAQGVGGNRRDPGGPSDPEVCVVGVQDAATSEWRACMVCYALHPTVLHAESTLVSADYPAYVRGYLDRTKPGMITLFAQGTSGNQSTRYFRSGQNFEEAERIGTAIGVETGRVLDNMTLTSEAALLVKSTETDMEFRLYPDRGTAEANVRNAASEFDRLRSSGAAYIDVRNAELKVFGAEDILAYIKLQEMGVEPELVADEFPFEIQVIGIGDARIVGIQGEAFVEIGLEIKRKSPFGRTFVLELSNGAAPGYIYTRESLKEGGYETDTSMFGPRCADILIETAINLLKETGENE